VAESRFSAEEIVWEDIEKKNKYYTKIKLILCHRKTVKAVSVCNWLSVEYSGVLPILRYRAYLKSDGSAAGAT
jgi:hypothetical protein